jgi:hypothetical protein
MTVLLKASSNLTDQLEPMSMETLGAAPLLMGITKQRVLENIADWKNWMKWAVAMCIVIICS